MSGSFRSPGPWQLSLAAAGWLVLAAAVASGQPNTPAVELGPPRTPSAAQQGTAAPSQPTQSPAAPPGADESDSGFSVLYGRVGYIDSAIPTSQLRLRFDASYNNNRPSRAEFI